MQSTIWLAVILLAWANAQQVGAQEAPAKTPLPAVSVYTIGPAAAGHGARYSAELQPFKQVDVAFKVGGYIQEILQMRGVDGQQRNVQAGDRVVKGTVLARVREVDYVVKRDEARAQLAEAQAAREQVKAQRAEAQAAYARATAELAAAQVAFEKASLDFERARNLFATQSLTKADYDTAKANFDGTQARVDAARAQQAQAQANEAVVKAQSLGIQAKVEGARAQLEEAEIALRDSALKAPFDAVVVKRSIEVGSLVGAGTVAFTLADTAALKAVFGVPAILVTRLRVGRPLTLSFEALPGAEFRGPITRIDPTADAKSRVFDVEVTLPNPQDQLKIGFIGALEIDEERGTGALPVVPLTAIMRPREDPTGYAVFVVQERDGKHVARLRKVKPGGTVGDMIAIVDGVQLGERVITTGAAQVVDGAPVQIIP
jgi:multidrug efflux pump subunit AcrA (membrane-fusion protein)